MKAPRLAPKLALLTLLGLPFTAQAATIIGASHDTWVREDNPDSNRNGNDQMNARTDLDADDNDVTFLRFPTVALTDTAASAILNLYWQRSDGGTGNTLSLYGLNESHAGETTWDETTLTYNNAPGLLPDGVDPTTELANLNSFDDIRDLDLANLTLLVDGQDYGPQVLDEAYSFSGTALTDFINADTNGEVTFLILRGNESTSGNQARFWPKESGISPNLDVTLVPEPNSLVLLGLAGMAAFVRRRS